MNTTEEISSGIHELMEHELDAVAGGLCNETSKTVTTTTTCSQKNGCSTTTTTVRNYTCN